MLQQQNILKIVKLLESVYSYGIAAFFFGISAYLSYISAFICFFSLSASSSEIRLSGKLMLPWDSFSVVELVNLTNLKPQPFGSKETFTIPTENTELKYSTKHYFVICAYHEKHTSAEVSNIAVISVFVPLHEEPDCNCVSKSIWSAVLVAVIICLIVRITDHVARKYKIRTFVEAVGVYKRNAFI